MGTPLAWTDEPGQTVSTSSYREQASRIIRAQIVSGRLEPGSMHSIREIAENLQVSITPVREALHDLAKDGLIEMKRNRGFLVRTPNSKELDEIVQLRTMLEVGAVRDIAARTLVKDFSLLRELCRRTETCAEASDWDGFLTADRELHLTLLAWLGNSKLVALVGQLRDQSRLFGLDRLAGTEQIMRSTREHAELLDAIEAGDAERAGDIMTTHLGHVRGLWAGRSEA